MLEKIKNAIELSRQTRGVVYEMSDNFEKIITKEGIIFGISKNGMNQVFFDGAKAKKWKKDTGGTLCNVYHMLNRRGENEVLNLVSSSKDIKTDLKTWLRIKGIKVTELSEVLEVNYQTLTRWVNKKSLPDIVSGQRIARELGIDVAQIEW